MQRTSHWAALYFVALMTFGNYVLFNLLVAILVEGFSNQVGMPNNRSFCRMIVVGVKLCFFKLLLKVLCIAG